MHPGRSGQARHGLRAPHVPLTCLPTGSKLYRTVRYWEVTAMQDTTRFGRCGRIVRLLLAGSLLAAAGCAPLPRTDAAPTMKKVQQLGSADSFTAPVAAWPGDGWWRAYGDPQLDGLIDEGLRGSPDLDLAKARLTAAAAMVKSAHAARLPEITGTAAFTQQKQSYNNLIPKE